MGKKLFVASIPYTATEDELAALFRSCGTVTHVHILIDRPTGKSKGVAFVEMSTEAEARTAIQKLSKAQLGGRTIFVSEARPKPEGGAPAGGPGFKERRSGRDRRKERGEGAGPASEGEPRREFKKKWVNKSDSKPWEKMHEGRKRPWEKGFDGEGKSSDRKSGGGKKWGKKPGGGGGKPWKGKPRRGGPKKWD